MFKFEFRLSVFADLRSQYPFSRFAAAILTLRGARRGNNYTHLRLLVCEEDFVSSYLSTISTQFVVFSELMR